MVKDPKSKCIKIKNKTQLHYIYIFYSILAEVEYSFN